MPGPSKALGKNRWSAGTTAITVLLGLFFTAFLIYPLSFMLRHAFFADGTFTLKYFGLLISNPVITRSMANSLFLAAATTALTTVITLPLAQAMTRYSFRGQSLLGGLLLIPMVMPPFVGAIGLKQLLARYGSVNLFLIDAGLVNPANPPDWLGVGSLTGIIALQVLSLYPIMFLNVSAAMANVDPSLREAAQNLGGSPWRIFRTVTLPLILPGWFAGAIIVFIWAFTDLGTPLIFGFSQVVPVQIFDAITDLNTNPAGYALVVVVLGLTLVLFLLSRQWLAQRTFGMMSRGHVLNASIPATPRQTALFWGAAAALVFVGLLPHLTVVLQSVSGRWFFSVLPESITGSHFAELSRQTTIANSIRNSLVYASLSAVIDLVLGVAIAWLVTRRRVPFAPVLDALAMIPLALPGLVIAFGYVAAFDFNIAWLNPRNNPTFLLVVAYAVRRLPYIVRSATAGFQQTSVTLEEASANLGATPFQTLRRITLPLITAHLIAGAILTFSLAMLEVSDGLILAMKENHFPITKMIWLIMGRIDPSAGHVACALGVVGMVILTSSLLLAGRLLGRRLGQLFRT